MVILTTCDMGKMLIHEIYGLPINNLSDTFDNSKNRFLLFDIWYTLIWIAIKESDVG